MDIPKDGRLAPTARPREEPSLQGFLGSVRLFDARRAACGERRSSSGIHQRLESRRFPADDARCRRCDRSRCEAGRGDRPPGLECLGCGMGAGPGPLEIIAAEPAGDVDRLADHIEAGKALRLHRFRRQFRRADPADGDFRLGKAFGAVRAEWPVGEGVPRRLPAPDPGGWRARLPATSARQVSRRAGRAGFGTAGGFNVVAGIVALRLTKPAAGLVGQEIHSDRLPVPPIGRDLQDGRDRTGRDG